MRVRQKKLSKKGNRGRKGEVGIRGVRGERGRIWENGEAVEAGIECCERLRSWRWDGTGDMERRGGLDVVRVLRTMLAAIKAGFLPEDYETKVWT